MSWARGSTLRLAPGPLGTVTWAEHPQWSQLSPAGMPSPLPRGLPQWGGALGHHPLQGPLPQRLRTSVSRDTGLAVLPQMGRLGACRVVVGGALPGAGAVQGCSWSAELGFLAQGPHLSWRAWGWGCDRQGCGNQEAGY